MPRPDKVFSVDKKYCVAAGWAFPCFPPPSLISHHWDTQRLGPLRYYTDYTWIKSQEGLYLNTPRNTLKYLELSCNPKWYKWGGTLNFPEVTLGSNISGRFWPKSDCGWFWGVLFLRVTNISSRKFVFGCFWHRLMCSHGWYWLERVWHFFWMEVYDQILKNSVGKKESRNEWNGSCINQATWAMWAEHCANFIELI